MNTKILTILGVILIAVIGIIILSEKLGSQKATGKSKEFFPGFSISTCSAFSITDNKGTIKIQKKGDIWVIGSAGEEEVEDEEEGTSILEKTEGEEEVKESVSNPYKEYPADSASVASALEKISAMKKDELISQNPEKQAVFEVDSAKGIQVEVFDNQNKSFGQFKIGKSGSDWSSHYVRVIGSDDVYSVQGSIKYSFFTDVNRWRDKTVIKFDKTLAQKISIAKKDTATAEVSTIVLEKTVDTLGAAIWNITAPEKCPADSTAVTQIVDALSSLKTSKWEENLELADSAMGFDAPDLVVSVELENGDTKMVTVGKQKKDGSEKWVKSADKDAIFLMYKSKFNNIEKPLDELKKKEEEKKEESSE